MAARQRTRFFALIIISALLFFSPLIFAIQTLLTNLQITATANTTKITLTLDQAITYKVFTLANPDRLVIDLPQSRDAFDASNVQFANTMIKGFRHGIQNGTDLRLVFDLTQPVKFSSNTDSQQDFQITVQMTPQAGAVIPATKPGTSANANSTVTASTVATKNTNASPESAIDSQINQQINAQLASAKSSTSATTSSTSTNPSATTANNVTTITTPALKTTSSTSAPINKEDVTDAVPTLSFTPPSRRDFIVVIDAGHGGKDPGTTGPHGTHEKNITLAIARDLQQLVDAQPGMHAVMTRDGDYYVGLRQRLMIARRAKGDMFVAIHADAYKDADADGASVFALSLHGASSEAALWLAQKENYSELGGIDLDNIQDPDSQVRSVLIDLSQTATISASVQLGTDVIKQLGGLTSLHHGYVEQAPFMVLKSPDIPSILVETGFLSNPKEEARLSSTSYQQEIAHALFKGIENYVEQSVPRTAAVAITQ